MGRQRKFATAPTETTSVHSYCKESSTPPDIVPDIQTNMAADTNSVSGRFILDVIFMPLNISDETPLYGILLGGHVCAGWKMDGREIGVGAACNRRH